MKSMTVLMGEVNFIACPPNRGPVGPYLILQMCFLFHFWRRTVVGVVQGVGDIVVVFFSAVDICAAFYCFVLSSCWIFVCLFILSCLELPVGENQLL